MQQKEIIKNLFPGYYRKYDQDMETLADLTKRAKGDERSINEFARACGVSPSTISRLINKKNTTDSKSCQQSRRCHLPPVRHKGFPFLFFHLFPLSAVLLYSVQHFNTTPV